MWDGQYIYLYICSVSQKQGEKALLLNLKTKVCHWTGNDYVQNIPKHVYSEVSLIKQFNKLYSLVTMSVFDNY